MRLLCLSSLVQTINRVDKYNMQELDKIGEDLFNKIRGRFPSITIGNEAGEVINEPSQARFFDFEYKESDKVLGNVSVNITQDEGMTVIFSKDFISNEDSLTKDNWYGFLKELRLFAKKRMLEFSIRDITKSNLTKRDYKFLSKRTGDNTMAESKLYGTSRISYQDVGSARLVIKHTESVNQEQATGRTRNVGTIYIESSEGERFKYPYKHLNGARAMARHVAEGGNAYDDFGKHIVSLSEEQAKLSKFKRYMSRSAVMAESLAEYNDAVNDRITTVKKTLQNLQKKDYYAETFKSFAPAVMEDVPTDVAENWIDQLTIKQFNEELKDIFPYVFKLVSEVSKAKELGPDDLEEDMTTEGPFKGVGKQLMKRKLNKQHRKSDLANFDKSGIDTSGKTPDEIADMKSDYYHGHMDKADRAKKAKDRLSREEIELEQGFEEMMGQFGEERTDELLNLAVPALIAAARAAAPKLAQIGAKILSKGAQGAGAVAKGAGGVAIRNPGTTAAIGGGAYVGKKASDAIDAVGDMAGDLATSAGDILAKAEGGIEAIQGEISAFLGGGAVKQVASMAAKYALPALAVVALLYGGKKVIDMLKSKDDDEMQTASIEKEDDTMAVKIDKDGAISKDGDEAEKKQKTPIGEFILSYFDKETGEFPKGETAVLTMIEKDYGEQFIEPAKAFIEQVQAKFEEYQMQAHPQQMETDDEDDEDEDENDDLFKDDEFTAMDQEDDDEVNKHFERMRELAGLR